MVRSPRSLTVSTLLVIAFTVPVSPLTLRPRRSTDLDGLWTVTYDGLSGGDDSGVDVGVLPTGEVVVLASITGATGTDQALLLYSSEDGQLLDVDIDTTVDDPVGLAITMDGVIYTTGNTASGDGYEPRVLDIA